MDRLLPPPTTPWQDSSPSQVRPHDFHSCPYRYTSLVLRNNQLANLVLPCHLQGPVLVQPIMYNSKYTFGCLWKGFKIMIKSWLRSQQFHFQLCPNNFWSCKQLFAQLSQLSLAICLSNSHLSDQQIQCVVVAIAAAVHTMKGSSQEFLSDETRTHLKWLEVDIFMPG